MYISYQLGLYFIKPGFVHRVVSTNDLKMVESSTLHLDDVLEFPTKVKRAWQNRFRT